MELSLDKLFTELEYNNVASAQNILFDESL
jgi:hypothetical protein